MKLPEPPLAVKLAGGLAVFTVITVFFSPMFWMGLLLGPLPPLVLILLFIPVLYQGYSEKKNKNQS